MTSTVLPAAARPAPADPVDSAAEADPRWVRPALLLLLGGTALLYLWDLGASGWANAYYSSAVQAGSQSWKAFFFGALDAGGSITVDKPPMSLWAMGLSVRIFGLNSWSLLVPQALMGVAAVGVLHATVRRQFSPAAGLFAGAALALTPVATLMFRFDNPDALLTLLLVGATYAMVRATETSRTAWLVAAATLVGCGFLTKMLQALLVLPVFVLVYLVVADTPLRRRLLQLLAAAATLVVAGGWWVAVVELLPSSARPYIGGSQTDSVLELVLGYNGLGRITGDEAGSVGGGNGAGGRWGTPGLLRMFDAEFGSQVAWLLPAALLLLLGLLWMSRRARRTSPQRAQVLLWGGTLVLTGLTFSLMQGIIHPYYAVALAPSIAALVGIGAAELWRHRARPEARWILAVATASSGLCAGLLLDRAAGAWSVAAVALIVLGLGAAAALAVLPWLGRTGAAAAAVLALGVALAGPAAYSVDTALTPHIGSLPAAGPATAGSGGPGRGGFPGPPRNAGGLLDATDPSSQLSATLSADADAYTWVAATVGANNAAGYQLATGEAVMAIGGFNGTDPSPTLAQFQKWVAAGRIHYYLSGASRGPGGPGASESAAAIAAWVQSTFTATTVDGVTLYDLTGPTS